MNAFARRLGMAVLVASWALTVSGPTVHADEGWVITSFHSDIAVATDSTLTVTEDVRVDFGSLQKHGIFRTIPLRYRYDDSRDRYYLLEVKSVTDGSKALIHSDYIDHDNQVIKIGDPARTVSGAQRYVISYVVQGAMNSFADHDELFWNVDGALWPVAKRSVTATVNLPPRAFEKAACDINPVTVGLSLLIAIAGIGLVVRNWWIHGRDRAYLTQYYLTNDPRDRSNLLFQHDPLVVEFGPPQKMKPAELGLILDESADTKDVTATIVDLAVRGLLTIAEVPGQKDWTLTSKAGGDMAALLPYEKTLLDGLFAPGPQIKLSELKGTCV